MRIGPALSICATAKATPALNPATLALTGWWRDFAVVPWLGTASAGTSGSGLNDLVTAGAGLDPAVGIALNGHGTADFDGLNDQLNAEGTFDTYSAAQAFSIWALVNIDVLDGFGEIIFGVLGTPRFWLYSATDVGFSALGANARRAGLSTGAWMLFTARYDGAVIQVGINEAPGAAGGLSSVANPGNLPLTGAVAVGPDPSATKFFNGRIAEIGVTDTVLSDATFAQIKSYINTRYGLAL